MSTTDTGARAATRAMADGRRADSARRRERVLTALGNAIRDGEQISGSGIARAAGVDRTFLYRHHELLDQVHAANAQPPGAPGTGPAVSRASLQADLLAAQQRCVRITARAQHSKLACPPCSESKPGASPASAPPTTSTSSNSRSWHSNNTSSTCASNSKNATKTSRPRAPPTANS